jgi:hypothetical protein
MRVRYTLLALFGATTAFALWLTVVLLVMRSPVSPFSAVLILIAMSLSIYVPIRRWQNAWVIAGLVAGTISVVSLLIAALLAHFN